MTRESCAICNQELNHLYTLNKMPISLSCVELDAYKYNTLSFSKCSSCNTIQLNNLIPLDELYKHSHNTISVGKTWNNYFNVFIEKMQDIIIDKTILEIGCPSGKIARRCNNYNKWYIVEPNKNKDILFDDKIIFIETFFDNVVIEENVDLIVHSHLFEHIYLPNEFLKKCNELLKDDGEMIFGVPDMQYMVDKTLFLGVFFEHTIFLNKENITYLLNKNGFEIIEIIDFENHSTIYHTKKTKPLLNQIKIQDYSGIFFGLMDEYKLFIETCNRTIQQNKEVYIFGASYNTQTLLFFGLNQKIKGILDNCKEKWGKYFYGTSLKIFSPEVLNDDSVVILKNGYYSNEIYLQIKEINPNIFIIRSDCE